MLSELLRVVHAGAVHVGPVQHAEGRVVRDVEMEQDLALFSDNQMGSEILSQNRICRCCIHRVVNVVIVPNAMISEWRNCFESAHRSSVWLRIIALKPCPMFSFFLLWKRPRDVGNVITSEIRVTITAMIFDFARSGALAATFRSLVSTVSHFILRATLFMNVLTDLCLSFDALQLEKVLTR